MALTENSMGGEAVRVWALHIPSSEAMRERLSAFMVFVESRRKRRLCWELYAIYDLLGCTFLAYDAGVDGLNSLWDCKLRC